MDRIIIITLVAMVIIAAQAVTYLIAISKTKRHTRALNAALAGASAVILDLVHQCEEQRKLLMDQQRLIEEPFTDDEIAAIRKMAKPDDSVPFNLVDLDTYRTSDQS